MTPQDQHPGGPTQRRLVVHPPVPSTSHRLAEVTPPPPDTPTEYHQVRYEEEVGDLAERLGIAPERVEWRGGRGFPTAAEEG